MNKIFMEIIHKKKMYKQSHVGLKYCFVTFEFNYLNTLVNFKFKAKCFV